MDTHSQHLAIDYHGCDPVVLDDPARLRRLLVEAARAAGATVVAVSDHRFEPQGVSVVVVLEESHLSIHSWPEHRHAAVDFFTCGDCHPERAHDVVAVGLGAQRADLLRLLRGRRGEPGGSLRAQPPWQWVAQRPVAHRPVTGCGDPTPIPRPRQRGAN